MDVGPVHSVTLEETHDGNLKICRLLFSLVTIKEIVPSGELELRSSVVLAYVSRCMFERQEILLHFLRINE